MILVMTALTGLFYPLTITGIAQGIFNEAANGSLIEHGGEVVGSRLLAGEEYFQPRPSAADYDPRSSSGSNLGPTNPELLEKIEARADHYRTINGLSSNQPVPVDAVTASASGLDPDISVMNARLQAPRVAEARGLNVGLVMELIDEMAQDGGLLGPARVNVLEINIALEEARP
jgi:K+-transporting ATPase ATPase C chain